MWKNVVNSINLSEQQKHDVVSWKQCFMQKVRHSPCVFVCCVCHVASWRLLV